MNPLTPAPSSSPAAAGSARSNRAALLPPATRTAAGYTGTEGASSGSTSTSAAGAAQSGGTCDGEKRTVRPSQESSESGHVSMPSSINPSHTSYMEDHVARMQAEIERTTRRLEIEKRRLHELGESSRKAQHEFQDKRLRYSFNKAGAQAERLKAENNVLLLENRLSQALCKLDSGSDDINKLKALIDKHRKDRLAMDKVYRHVHRELTHHTEHLNHAKEKLAQLQEWEHQSTRRMDELNKAKEQEREAFKQHCLTMQKELREQDRLIKEFDIRAHRESSMQRTQMKCSPYSVAEEEHTFNPESLMKLIFKTSLLNAVHRHNIRQYKNKISVFEKAMESIKISTGISDAEEIVSIFSQLEERNYSVMTYVNNINVELESLESKKRQLEMHMQQQAHHDATAQRLADETLRDVAAQISNTKLATEGKNALIQRQLQGLLQSYEMLEATVNMIRSCWKGPGALEEPPPREPGPFGAGGERRDLLPMLWFIQKFFESHKELLRAAKSDSDLPDAIATAHAWVAARASEAANTHATGCGVQAASGGAHAVTAAGVRHTSLGSAYIPSAGVNSLGPRTLETGSNTGSTTQGRVFAGGGPYARGRSSPAAGTAATTTGAAGGGSVGSGSRITGSSTGGPMGGNNPWSGGPLNSRKTINLAITSGYRSSVRTNPPAAGELRAASTDVHQHMRMPLRRSAGSRRFSSQNHAGSQYRSLSCAPSPATSGPAASAAIASGDDATTGACDAGEIQRCATADSCTETAADAAGETQSAARDTVVSASSSGGSGAFQRAVMARAAAESRSGPSDEEEEEERDEDSGDEKSPVPGDVVPLSSEELRERTIYLFNRMRKKKAAAEGNMQPPILYLPEKRCLLASPGARDGVASLSPLLPSVANSPLPGSPPPIAAPRSSALLQSVSPDEPARAAVHSAVDAHITGAGDHAEAAEAAVDAAEAACSGRDPAGAEFSAENKGASVTGEATTGFVPAQEPQQSERKKTDSAERRVSVGSAGCISSSARRSSTTNSVKQGESGGALGKKNPVPRFFAQSSRMLFGRQKEKRYSRIEPARRSVLGAKANAVAEPERTSGRIQLEQRQQFPHTPGRETKSPTISGAETSWWRRVKLTKQSLERNGSKQADRSSQELHTRLSQPLRYQQQTEKPRQASFSVSARSSISNRKRSLTRQESKEVKAQLQHKVPSGTNTEKQEDKQGGQQQTQDGDIHPGKQPPTVHTRSQREEDERQQELCHEEPEQQPHEQQKNHQDGQPKQQGQQSQQLVHSQKHGEDGSSGEHQTVVTTTCNIMNEAQIHSSDPNTLPANPDQQGVEHANLQQHLELQEVGCLENMNHDDASCEVQPEDQVCGMQQEVQKKGTVRQQYAGSQEMQAETSLQPVTSPEQEVGRQEGEEATDARGTRESSEERRKASIERVHGQREPQPQDNYISHQQPSETCEDPQSDKVEQQPTQVDLVEEVPSCLSVVLRQVPVSREPQEEEDQEGQPPQQTTGLSGRPAALPLQPPRLSEPLHAEMATTPPQETPRQIRQDHAVTTAATERNEERTPTMGTQDTVRQIGQEHAATTVEAGGEEETPPGSARGAHAENDSGVPSMTPDATATADRQGEAEPPSNSGASSSSSSDDTCSGVSSLPFELGKRSSATVLAALWARCETIAAEEEVAARQQEQQRDRELSERGTGEKDGTETPQPQNGAQSNEVPSRQGEDLYREHLHQRVDSDDTAEAAREGLLRVMERALVQVESMEEGQKQEGKEEEGTKEKHQQSRAGSAESASVSFYASSPFAFLPANEAWRLGGSVSPSPSRSGAAQPDGATKTSRPASRPTSSDAAVVPPAATSQGGSAGGANSLASTPRAATKAGIERGADAHVVDKDTIRTGEAHEQHENKQEKQLAKAGYQTQSASKLCSSGTLQSGHAANSAVDSSSSDAVGRCNSSADSGGSRDACLRAGGAGGLSGQTPKSAVAGTQPPRLNNSIAEQSVSGYAAASPVASEAAEPAGRPSSAPSFRQQGGSPGRPTSPLPPTVVAAAFQAIRRATASSSTVGAGAEADGRRVGLPDQRPESAVGTPQRCFSAGAVRAAARVNSASPEITSAPAFLNREPSSSGPLDGLFVGLGRAVKAGSAVVVGATAVASEGASAGATEVLTNSEGTVNARAPAECRVLGAATASFAESFKETRNESTQEAVTFPSAPDGAVSSVAPSASLSCGAAAAAAPCLPSSNAGTRPPSRSGMLAGTPVAASPLSRERVAAAAAALAALSGSSLGRLPSGSPPGSFAPAVAAALQDENNPLAATGVRAGAVSPATLALLRQRSGAAWSGTHRPFATAALNAAGSSRVAATPTAAAGAPVATGEGRWQSQTLSSRRPSSPAAIAAAVAAGAVVTIPSSPFSAGLSCSRPLSAQVAAARPASAGDARRHIEAEEVQFQQQQQGQQYQIRSTNEEQLQDMQKKPHTPTHPGQQAAYGEQEEENHQLPQQQQVQERQQQQQQMPADSRTAAPQLPSLPAAPPLSETHGESRRHLSELGDATAGVTVEVAEQEAASALAVVSPSPGAVNDNAGSRLSALTAGSIPSEERCRKEEYCIGGGSTAVAEGNCVSGPAAALASTEEAVAPSVAAAAESPDSKVANERAHSPQMETAAAQDATMPSELLVLQQRESSYIQGQKSCGEMSSDGIVDRTKQRTEEKLEGQQGAEDFQRDSEKIKREDEAASNSELRSQHLIDGTGAAPSVNQDDSTPPQNSEEHESELHKGDETSAREQGDPTEVQQATQAAEASSNRPEEVGDNERLHAGATAEPASGNAFVKSVSADSPPVGHRASQATDLRDEEKSPASGALPNPTAEDSAFVASTDAFNRTTTAAHPRAATAGATGPSNSLWYSEEVTRPASVSNKHVSLNIQEEHEQRQQLYQYGDEQQQPYSSWQQHRRSRLSQQSRRSHMSLLSPNRRSTRLSNAELFQFSPPDLQPPENDSPPGTPPSAASSRPATAADPTAQEPAEEEAFSAVVEGNRFVARVSRVEKLPPQQPSKTDED